MTTGGPTAAMAGRRCWVNWAAPAPAPARGWKAPSPGSMQETACDQLQSKQHQCTEPDHSSGNAGASQTSTAAAAVNVLQLMGAALAAASSPTRLGCTDSVLYALIPLSRALHVLLGSMASSARAPASTGLAPRAGLLLHAAAGLQPANCVSRAPQSLLAARTGRAGRRRSGRLLVAAAGAPPPADEPPPL